MKTLRQFCVATILSLMLAVSVLAGHMDTTGVAAPPPPPTNSMTQTTSVTTALLITVLDLIYG